MDPNQASDPFGGATGAPTPEVTPTPETTTPETAAPVEPTPAPVDTTPAVDPILTTAPVESPVENPVEVAPPTEPVAPEQPLADPAPVANPVEPVTPADPVAAPTPTPVVAPIVTGQPIVGSSATPAGQPKSKKGLMIGLIAGIGGLVVIAVVLVLFLFVFGGGKIKSVAELQDAVKNQKAINCTFTISMSGITVENYTFQTDDGWNNIHMKIPSMLNMEAWMVKDGDEYTMYTSAMGQYTKSTTAGPESSGAFDESYFTEDTIKDLECKPSSESDFTIPDQDWQESSSTSIF